MCILKKKKKEIEKETNKSSINNASCTWIRRNRERNSLFDCIFFLSRPSWTFFRDIYRTMPERKREGGIERTFQRTNERVVVQALRISGNSFKCAVNERQRKTASSCSRGVHVFNVTHGVSDDERTTFTHQCPPRTRIKYEREDYDAYTSKSRAHFTFSAWMAIFPTMYEY